MVRTFRYPLRPTAQQERVLVHWLQRCCELYNAALEERREAWRRQRVRVTYNRQQRELTELRAADGEWAAVPVCVERSAIRRVDRAFASFFRRVRRKEIPGFPRFRSSSRYDSLDLQGSNVRDRVDGSGVRLPTIGRIRFHCYRPIRGRVLDIRIRREPRGWFVSFVCDLGDAPHRTPPCNAIGIDVGLEAFATLSTGERVENPRFQRSAEGSVARLQRALAKKRRGSRGHDTARRLVALACEHIHHQRLDFSRKLAATLLARFDFVAYEDLTIKNLVRSNLAKSIYDASWGLFLRCLALKAEEAGKHVIAVDPRGTSQTCPQCGAVAKKTLDERKHRCPCGFVAHRDHAAALCILGRGLRLGQLTEAQ